MMNNFEIKRALLYQFSCYSFLNWKNICENACVNYNSFRNAKLKKFSSMKFETVEQLLLEVNSLCSDVVANYSRL